MICCTVKLLKVGVWRTVVLKLALLLLRLAAGAMETVLLMMVCKGVLLLTWTTKVNVAELLAGKESIQAETVPLELPGGGASLLQPGAAVQETSVVSAGSRSVRVTLLWTVELL